MRTINIYKFDELTHDSKMTAISNLRGEFETWYRENELCDIFQTKEKFESIFNINVLVEKEEESNSYDWFDYKNYTHSNGENDFDIFDEKRAKSLNCQKDTWSDYIFGAALKRYNWDLSASYGYNVSELFSTFINNAIDSIDKYLKKFDSSDVANYICDNDFEFYENGTRFIE